MKHVSFLKGLSIKRMEVDGQQVDMLTNNITVSSPLMDAWCYLVQLTASK